MIVAAALSLSVVSAAEPTAISADNGKQKTRFLPMRQRINRNIDQNKFVNVLKKLGLVDENEE